MNEVVQSIPEGNAHDMNPVYQEEAYESALHKIDDRIGHVPPPAPVVASNNEYDELATAYDVAIWMDASMYHYGMYIKYEDMIFTTTEEIAEEYQEAPAIDKELFSAWMAIRLLKEANMDLTDTNIISFNNSAVQILHNSGGATRTSTQKMAHNVLLERMSLGGFVHFAFVAGIFNLADHLARPEMGEGRARQQAILKHNYREERERRQQLYQERIKDMESTIHIPPPSPPSRTESERSFGTVPASPSPTRPPSPAFRLLKNDVKVIGNEHNRIKST